MISTRQAFHIGVVVYYITISHLMKENMLRHKEEMLNDPVIAHMNRFSARYLTRWTFVLQIVYFFVALGEEIVLLLRGQENLKSKVTSVKNYIFTALGAPMSFVVSTTFWSIWFVDRELIFPARIDKVLPPWLNHSLHTTTSLLVLLEMYLCYHRYPKFKSALIGITLYLLFYGFCLFGTYFETGIWLYPILGVIGWGLRAVFGLAVYAMAIGMYGIGYLANKILWGDEVVQKTKKKQKKH